MEKTMETRKLKDTGEDETMTIEIKQAVMKREMAKVEKSFNTQRKSRKKQINPPTIKGTEKTSMG